MPIYVSTAMGLIQAIGDANNDLGNVYEIELQADIGLSSQVDTLFGPVGTPVVKGQVVINGAGAGYKIERTSGTIRLFSVNAKSGAPNASLTLRNLHLHNGDAGGSAGSGLAVNDGRLVLENCTISNCRGATNGGAIYNGDGCNMVVNNCAFVDNYATGSNGRGGAIYNSSGSSLEIKDTVFAGNKALGAGSLGGAIYRHSGGSVLIINSAFCGNEAPSASHIYNNSSAFDATQSWWGAVGGPPGGTIGGPVDYEPYRTTLPRFVPTPGITENPCLPSIVDNCKIKIMENESANVYLGPSDDDLFLRDSGGSVVTLQDTDEVDARAYAIDENSDYWYGYEDVTNRPHYLSWVKATTAYLDDCESNELANFNTQAHDVYSDDLVISHLPVRTLDDESDFGPVKGFGLNEAQYSNFPGSRHPGVDFFPDEGTSSDLLAVTGGIVVGMGRVGSAAQPVPWGSVGNGMAGYNLVVRTNGYFLLYGHLATIEPSLYLGARVFPADLLGTIIQQQFESLDNTHIHLEVRVFNEEFLGAEPLRCKFGALKASPPQVPGSGPGSGKTPQAPLAIDPMKFVPERGTPGSPSGSNTPFEDGELIDYQGQLVAFDYNAATDLIDNCFDITLPSFNVLTSCPPEAPGYCFE